MDNSGVLAVQAFGALHSLLVGGLAPKGVQARRACGDPALSPREGIEAWVHGGINVHGERPSKNRPQHGRNGFQPPWWGEIYGRALSEIIRNHWVRVISS